MFSKRVLCDFSYFIGFHVTILQKQICYYEANVTSQSQKLFFVVFCELLTISKESYILRRYISYFFWGGGGLGDVFEKIYKFYLRFM